MDYYNILGLRPDATDEQIKNSYKKLAKKHHPDAGGDTELFYQIAEAYQTLINPISRQDYDYEFGNVKNYYHPEEVYYKNVKNRDIKISYTITLEESISGKDIDLSYKLSDNSTVTISLHIPAGIRQGDTLRIKGSGDNYIKSNPRGDLLLSINIKSKKGWVRDGDNLSTVYAVNALDLITGCDIMCTVPHHGNINIKIPAGTQPGAVFSSPGYGVPNINTGKCGALFVTITAMIPRITDVDFLRYVEIVKKHAEKENQVGNK